MNGDITYCMAECQNKHDCERNPNNRPFKNLPYSVSDFSLNCDKYKRLDYKDNCRS